ncbi:MAG: RNA polymerase sigma factor [Crocinitomicaceae bacterium]|nr:RNA polymerase sigma factor [Crocinitomicaceae bacterium]
MDDATLIIECVNGNARAQRLLFDKFARKMFSVCLRYAKNEEQAEDVLQDGFIKVFGKLKDFKSEGSLEGWIRRIMVNTALDQIRKNNKQLGDTNIDDVGYKIENNDFIVEKMMAEDLMKMVQAMPDGYKVVFNMFAIEGYSHGEIADTLGISENTSKSQYSRARAYLRERLEKN